MLTLIVLGKGAVMKIIINLLESLLKRKLILKISLVVILKKYKTGLITILENYLIINRLKIFFMRI